MGWFGLKKDTEESEGEKLTAQEIINEVDEEQRAKFKSLVPESIEVYGVKE